MSKSVTENVAKPQRTRLAQPERWRRYWDKHAGSYDGQMKYFDKLLFGDSREWACRQAAGDVLEIGIGTGLSLPHYPAGARLTAIEFSPGMLEIARRRSAELDRPVEFQMGDAQQLGFPDESFDSVVAAFTLCSIADEPRAVAELRRVLRPGGRLLLADHVVSSSAPLRGVEWLLEVTCVPRGVEHFRRRPLDTVRAAGFLIERAERFKFGIVERLAARKPATEPPASPAVSH
jgi:ubiquinone/menaquinone biosynthesis C-methylase UbiE